MGHKPEIKDWLFSKAVARWAIALAVVGTIATGAATIYILNRTEQRSKESTPSPSATPAIEAVTALGTLEPAGKVIKLSAPNSLQGAKVDQLLVSEGEQVRAEQAIAILDNRDSLRAAVELAQKQVKIAQANLAKVKAGKQAGTIAAQVATIKRIEEELRGEKDAQQAKINRLQTQLEQTKQAQDATIQAQESTVRRLEAELRNVQEDLTRYQQLVQDGVISQSELESRRLRVETAVERLSEAQANLIEAQANRIQTLSTISTQLEEAIVNRNKTVAVLEAQINEAKAKLDEIKEVRPVDVQQAEAEVERAWADVEKAQKDLESAYVKASEAGKILKIHTRPGEIIDQEKGILHLGQTNQMMVVAEVYESDIAKVHFGQRVAIKSEGKAFAGELRGSVSYIGQQIGKKDVLNTDPAADVDARVVEVEIRLNPEDSKRVKNLTNSKVVVEIYL
ncbi:MAG TPA: ABC transporter permease [Cyanobacteria bacterium UBA8803]|nr:ABC transporter permease [Cyanobacteria bacterium UBA8803]